VQHVDRVLGIGFVLVALGQAALIRRDPIYQPLHERLLVWGVMFSNRSASSFVPAGRSDHASGGETFRPSLL
jgi:hypothetical protein